jgi:transposase InsO family protein
MTSETTESAPEISDEGDSDSSASDAQPRHVEEQLLPLKRRRQHRSTKLSSLHSMQKADIQQRRRWLRQARGDKTALVTHRLQIPAYYHPDLDEHRHLDAVPVQSASEPWHGQQPSMVAWFTAVLKHHVDKINAVGMQQQQRQQHDAAVDQGAAQGVADPLARPSDSDWEEDYREAHRLPSGSESSASPSAKPAASMDDTTDRHVHYNAKSLMPDELYVELIKVLNDDDPLARLAALRESRPLLHRVIKRQLEEHGRYHIFWAHVDVCTADRPDVKHTRLIPVLFRVGASCLRTEVTLEDCKRCLPVSQVGALLDSIHSGGAHLKDSYDTLSKRYCGVPRKAVRLFAAKCHVCNRVEVKKRNHRAPRAILVDEVRQRYVLDLIDMQSWQRHSTDMGAKRRYIAHIIDHTSKKRWAEPILHKTGVAVVEVVRRVFAEAGHPAVLHTDNGTEFANAQVEQECRRWGTRIIHGRPYHPESQGIVENANGALQRAMDKYRRSHPTYTDWTWVLSQVLPWQNRQVHSVTGMSPDEHFRKFNHFSRDVRPLPPDEHVVITMRELATIPQLAWVAPCEVLAHDGSQPNMEPTHVEPTHEDAVESTHQDAADLTEPDSINPPAPAPPSAAHALPAQPLPAAVRASRPRARPAPAIHVLAPGEDGEFTGPEWDRDLGPQVRQLLHPTGTVANGDCGPASGYGIHYGAVATAAEAAQLRRHVLAWSHTTAGQAYYAEHVEGELRQVPRPLPDVQAVWAQAREWVTPEFLTCFGGMLQLNVFLLMRTTSDDGHVHCGIALVTNGGTLIKTEEADVCCVYFQNRLVTQTGHYEVVRDAKGQVRWRADDVVTDCLWAAMVRTQVARSVRDMRNKMLVAAHNRVNLNNESFQVGDCAWLTVPPAIVKQVTAKLKKKREKQAATEAKLLVKVWAITTLPGDPSQATQSSLPTQQFVLCTEDGRLDSAFSIDQLQRCDPPPEPSLYRVVDLDLQAVQEKKPIKLSRAYTRYVTLIATRAACTSLAAPSAARRPPAQPQLVPGAAPVSTQMVTTATPTAIPAAAAPSFPSRTVDLTQSPESSGPAGVDAERVQYPCTHCRVTMQWDDYVFCYYRPCQAPFHKPGAGCTRHERAVVVDGMFYCRQACASLDRAYAPRDPAISQPQPAAPALPLGPQEDVDDQASQSSEPQIKRLPLCNSCLEPVQWKVGAGCDSCSAYHHKIPRTGEGCTRPGWTKGGSRRVGGVLQCVPCRFAADADWRRFSRQAVQRAER